MKIYRMWKLVKAEKQSCEDAGATPNQHDRGGGGGGGRHHQGAMHQPLFDWRDYSWTRGYFGTEFCNVEFFQSEKKKMLGWGEMYKRNGSGLDMLRTAEYTALLERGVPHSLRRSLWQINCGSAYRKTLRKGAYVELWERSEGKESIVKEQIERDLNRSFDYPVYTRVVHVDPETGAKARKESPGLVALRRVLSAYSWYNPRIGYCQSMNVIAAVLLLFMTEEEAFWVLATLVEDHLKGYFAEDLLGAYIDQKVFDVLVERHMPKLYHHLGHVLFMPTQWFSQWFMHVFVGKLPLKFVLNVVDLFTFKGAAVMFQVTMGLLKHNEVELMALEDDDKDHEEEIMNMFQETTQSTSISELIKPWRDVITQEVITEMRAEYKFEVIKEREERNAKRK